MIVFIVFKENLPMIILHTKMTSYNQKFDQDSELLGASPLVTRRVMLPLRITLFPANTRRGSKIGQTSPFLYPFVEHILV